MDVQKSSSYIERYGTALEVARLRFILYGALPEPGVLEAFTKLQNRDGGFPFNLEQGRLSMVDNTLSALWWLDELGVLASPPSGHALDYLLAAQQEDGGWDEDPATRQYDLPPWIVPGDLKTRLYLTAYAAYWLALAGCHSSQGIMKALDFLLGHQDESGKLFGYLHTTWIAASVFFMAGDRYREMGEKALQFLENKPISDLADSQLAWILDCLGRAGISQDHPYISKCLAELVHRQSPEGVWSSEDGQAYTVSTTIEALKVLKYFGLLSDDS